MLGAPNAIGFIKKHTTMFFNKMNSICRLQPQVHFYIVNIDLGEILWRNTESKVGFCYRKIKKAL